MFHLITVSLVGPFENHVGTYSIFLQHFQQTLLWPVRMDPQLPEEVFGVTNFVAALILVDLSYKQQISLLPAISGPHDEHNRRFHTSDGHSSNLYQWRESFLFPFFNKRSRKRNLTLGPSEDI